MDHRERKSEPIQNAEEQGLLVKADKKKTAPSFTKLGVSSAHSDRQTSPWPVPKPSFKIWNAARSVRKTVQAQSIDELCEKGRLILELKGALTIVLETDGTEIEDNRILLDPEGPCRKDAALLLLQIGEKWRKEFLKENPPGNPISDSLYLLQAIKQNSSELRDFIDSEFGLLEELLRLGLLNEESYEDVSARSGRFKKNDCLLHYIKLKSTEKELLDFLEALRNTDQHHVANILLANGERLDLRYGLERPLGREEMTQLRANGLYFQRELLVTEGLLGLLYASRAITEKHMEHINGQGTRTKMIVELINIMRRRSLAAFKVFIRALHGTEQSHIAKVLSEPGAVGIMHINITKEMSPADIKQIETDLAAKMNELSKALIGGSAEKHSLWADVKDLWMQLELSGIRYKGACLGNSITVFLWCRDRRAMSCLLQMLESGHLKKIFQQTLTFLAHEVLPFTLKINMEEWKQAECYFQVAESRIDCKKPTPFCPDTEGEIQKLSPESEKPLSPGTVLGLEQMTIQRNSILDILPRELMEVILGQSLVSLLRLPWKASALSVSQQIFMLMASVCQEWRELLISRTWFSSTIKTYLKKNKHLAILQEHHAIFDQCLEVDCAFLWEMNRSSLLEDEQVSQMGSEPDHLKQTEQLFLKVFLRFSAENYAEFCKVLQRTSQGHIANYLEANGVMDLSQHDEWPLNDEAKANLDRAQSRLGDFVPPDEFLTTLEKIGCITKMHTEGISSLPESLRLGELMRILRKRSFVAYRQFAAVLRKLDQFAHVAQILAATNRSAHVNHMDYYEIKEKSEFWPDASGQGKNPNEVSDLKEIQNALANMLLEVGERLYEGHPVTLHHMNQIRTLWITFERLQPEEPGVILAKDSEGKEIHGIDKNLRMTESLGECDGMVTTQWIEDKNANTNLHYSHDEQCSICETTENSNLLSQSYKFSISVFRGMIAILYGSKLQPCQAIGNRQAGNSGISGGGDVKEDEATNANEFCFIKKLETLVEEPMKQLFTLFKKFTASQENPLVHTYFNACLRLLS